MAVREEALHYFLEKDARWKLVERVVAAPGFAKSPRLSSLLLHLVRQSLQGRDEELNEQLIGERVFGRPIGYDPRDDNIVRVHVSRLRQRLEIYFREEAADESLQITIPRGSYVPCFARIDACPSGHATVSTSNDSTDTRPKLSFPDMKPSRQPVRWIGFAGIFACIACLLLVTPFARRCWSSVRGREQSPTQALWSAIFSGNRDTLIVPADSSLIILKSFTRRSVSVADYASGRYLSDVTCAIPCDPHQIATLADHRYTSLADLQFAMALTHLPDVQSSRTQVRYARDLQLNDLQQDNLVLIGSLEADPWLQLFQSQMNFILRDDTSTGPLRIENRQPQGREPPAYRYDSDDPAHRGYALIAFLSNLSGTGSVLAVQGFTLADTQAAAEFLTDKHEFDALFAPLIAKRRGLPHFEILLRTMDVNGLGGRLSVIACRLH